MKRILIISVSLLTIAGVCRDSVEVEKEIKNESKSSLPDYGKAYSDHGY